MIDQHFFYPHIAQFNDPSVYFLNCAAVEISTLPIRLINRCVGEKKKLVGFQDEITLKTALII